MEHDPTIDLHEKEMMESDLEKGLADRKAGRMVPLSEIKREFAPVPTEELERLVLDAKMGCIGKPHAPGHKKGCDRCWSDERIGALAPALAAEVLALRKQNALALEALEAVKRYRAERGEQRGCVGEVHGDAHQRCGICFICLERKALAAMTGGSDD